jgi:hypothetical protein
MCQDIILTILITSLINLGCGVIKDLWKYLLSWYDTPSLRIRFRWFGWVNGRNSASDQF